MNQPLKCDYLLVVQREATLNGEGGYKLIVKPGDLICTKHKECPQYCATFSWEPQQIKLNQGNLEIKCREGMTIVAKVIEVKE